LFKASRMLRDRCGSVSVWAEATPNRLAAKPSPRRCLRMGFFRKDQVSIATVGWVLVNTSMLSSTAFML
jgi:hypothetical protein